MRWRAVKYFADRANTGFAQMALNTIEVTQCARRIAISLIVRRNKRAEQPTPHGALVILGVAFSRSTAIQRRVRWIARCKAA